MHRFIRVLVLGFLSLVLVLPFAGVGCAPKPPAPVLKPEPVVLNYVSFIPLTDTDYVLFKKLFIDPLNEKAKGELEINVRGGPEIIGSYDLPIAVQKGTIDIAVIPTAFLALLLPGSDVIPLSELTPREEEDTGANDYMREYYKEKMGLYFLGRAQDEKEGFFYLGLNKPVAKQEDFAGLKLGGVPGFFPFFKGLGAAVSGIMPVEYYSSLERGVVDGMATTIYFYDSAGLFEVIKYIIDPPFYRPSPVVIVNLDKWNQIPPHLQKLMTETQFECVNKWGDEVAPMRKASIQKGKGLGVEFVTLSPDVAAWYIKTAYDEKWKDLEKRVPGDYIPVLRKMLTK